MILPNDILLRTTSDGQTVWVSQRMVCEACAIDAEYLRKKARTGYKAALRSSWQAVSTQPEFFLGDKPGKAWRWGRKGGQYYYDYDHIPNRRPTCCRDLLPSREELIAAAGAHSAAGRRIAERSPKPGAGPEQGFGPTWGGRPEQDQVAATSRGRQAILEQVAATSRGRQAILEQVAATSRERQAAMRRMILERVAAFADNGDTTYYEEYTVGGKAIFTPSKARQLALSAAWCRFLKHTLAQGGHTRLGFSTQASMLSFCAAMLAEAALEGLRVKSGASLRVTLHGIPSDPALLRASLVSGKYGNGNRRIIGKHPLVDRTTGEILHTDLHETVIMTYWLNPGGSAKGTKRELWELYAADMESMGVAPVSPSTFNGYTNSWNCKLLSARERHGAKHFREAYRPYVPARALEFANSLWASDGSGVVPYRYQDKLGRWRMMKLYVMLVSDVASRCIAGYAVSRMGTHLEDGTMLRQAMHMALGRNGRTEVLDFLSDNHGAYTGQASREFLQDICRSVRTIAPGNSQANPAEMMFRLFKRRFKSYFRLPETSWGARSLESMANPDYYDIMELPDYQGAVEKLAAAVEAWNTTPLRNGLTPQEWFRTLKNPRAEAYSDRQWRRITGEVSRRDLSHARSVLELTRGGERFRFDIPSDAATVALIARHMGYAPTFEATVRWDAAGADVYTASDVYMFTCPPAPLASKSASEATEEGLAALTYHRGKADALERVVDDYAARLDEAREVLCRDYGFNIRPTQTKEEYNGLHERLSACGPGTVRAASAAPGPPAPRKTRAAATRKASTPGITHPAARKAAPEIAAPDIAAPDIVAASVDYHRSHIADMDQYLQK